MSSAAPRNQLGPIRFTAVDHIHDFIKLILVHLLNGENDNFETDLLDSSVYSLLSTLVYTHY